MQESRGGEGRQVWSQWIVLQHSNIWNWKKSNWNWNSNLELEMFEIQSGGKALVGELGWVWITLKEMRLPKLFLGILAPVESANRLFWGLQVQTRCEQHSWAIKGVRFMRFIRLIRFITISSPHFVLP